MDLSRLINDNGMYLYQDDSFNTINMQLCFLGEGGNKQDAINYVLCDYIMKSNELYHCLDDEMKKLYSMDAFFTSQRVGNTSNIFFCVDLVAPSVVEDNYLESAFGLIEEILLYPNFTDEKLLETIKRTYISKIIYKISDSSTRANRLFFDNVFNDENSRYSCSIDPEYIKDIINSITLDDLKEAYKKTINENSFYRGIVFGNISLEDFKLFRTYVPYKNNNSTIDYSIPTNISNEDKEISDPEANESTLYVTYEMDNADEATCKLFSSIFNGSNGLCHQILREKYGLVYSSYISIYVYRKAFVVKAKIDKNNKQKTLDAINEIISIAKDKDKLKELLAYAKGYIKSEDYLLSERKDDIIDNLDDHIRGVCGDFNYNEFIKNIDSYTEEDIASKVQTLKYKNTFMYRGDK